MKPEQLQAALQYLGADMMMNVFTYPPEAWRAMRVLDFDGNGWRDIYEAIHSGEIDLHPTMQHLQHAADVITAINNDDEIAMLRALVLMLDAVHEKEVGTLNSLLKHEEKNTRDQIARFRPMVREWVNKRKRRLNSLKKMQSINGIVTEELKRKLLQECIEYGALRPGKNLTEIRKHVARRHRWAWTTVQTHTPTLKHDLKRIRKSVP